MRNEISKVTRHQNNIQKLMMAFLYTHNKLLERGTEKIILFTVATKP